jgi:type 1 glutamine amidotransferase
MKRSLPILILLAVTATTPLSTFAADAKRVIVCSITTGFRHSSIAEAEKTLQQLADESKAFTIVDYLRQPDIQVPKKPNKPKDPASDADEKTKARYASELKKYNDELAKWTPDMELKAAVAEEGLKSGISGKLINLYPANLDARHIDGVIFVNTTGDLPLRDKEGFIKWIEEGHSFMGMHSASDTLHGFPGYIEMLGGEFATHGAQVPADLVKGDPAHPATAGLPETWNLKQEEVYQFKNHDREKVRALWFLRHHPNNPEQAGYAGVSWCKMAGKGRVFYTSLGHREDLWNADPAYPNRVNTPEMARQFQQHVLGGIKWALGLAEGGSQPNPEVK